MLHINPLPAARSRGGREAGDGSEACELEAKPVLSIPVQGCGWGGRGLRAWQPGAPAQPAATEQARATPAWGGTCGHGLPWPPSCAVMFKPRRVWDARLSRTCRYAGAPGDGEGPPSAQACFLRPVGSGHQGSGAPGLRAPVSSPLGSPELLSLVLVAPAESLDSENLGPGPAVTIPRPGPRSPAPWTWCLCLVEGLRRWTGWGSQPLLCRCGP